MATLIDSSVLIAVERGDLDLEKAIERLRGEEVAISAISASELLHGVYRARTVSQKHRRRAFVEHLLNNFPIVPFDLPVARVHAAIWADLAARGSTIGERDLMIAATPIAGGHKLATRDLRSFPRIQGLSTIRL